uniref:Uncharacterized protein n=1 Tax=Brassica campestris TaxID=3711 RepID=M4CFJ0_BRACM
MRALPLPMFCYYSIIMNLSTISAVVAIHHPVMYSSASYISRSSMVPPSLTPLSLTPPSLTPPSPTLRSTLSASVDRSVHCWSPHPVLGFSEHQQRRIPEPNEATNNGLSGSTEAESVDHRVGDGGVSNGGVRDSGVSDDSVRDSGVSEGGI